eukprot:2700891-Alexandrium_andersonii.AAC.1
MSTAMRAVPAPSNKESRTISLVCVPAGRSASGGSIGVLPRAGFPGRSAAREVAPRRPLHAAPPRQGLATTRWPPL